MRIRYKKWARPELEASKFYINEPEKCKGKWRKQFEKEKQPLHLELGCGKGQFIAKLAVENQEINYLAIDLVDAMLGLAKRNIEQSYQVANLEPKNVLLTRFDIERILLIIDSQDEVERIYINFCNPWPRGKHRKKRLTHSIQLEKYKQFLKEKGEIYFKTDDDELFEASLKYFQTSGLAIQQKTYDLQQEPIFGTNIQTEHEKMFTEQGIKIKACMAKLRSETVGNRGDYKTQR